MLVDRCGIEFVAHLKSPFHQPTPCSTGSSVHAHKTACGQKRAEPSGTICGKFYDETGSSGRPLSFPLATRTKTPGTSRPVADGVADTTAVTRSRIQLARDQRYSVRGRELRRRQQFGRRPQRSAGGLFGPGLDAPQKRASAVEPIVSRQLMMMIKPAKNGTNG